MKKEVLRFLKENQGEYFSGEKISEALGVSRTAIWKKIKKLKEEGYNIESISSKGYKLIESEDVLNNEEILLLTDEYNWIDKVYYFDTIDSTNDELKRRAFEEKGNLVAISKEQTKGRGRLGRTWESKDGIYMSYLIRPEILPENASLFTQIGAAAMISTFKVLSDVDVKVKWPNDIVINGKKICGILTELNAELNKVNYIILGIGVNLNQEKFNEELENIATSLFIETSKKQSYKKFVEVFLKEFDILLKEFVDNNNIEISLKICRDESAVIGKEINIINGENIRQVKAIDLNEKGQLVILNENNEKEEIFYGEVSIRGIGKEYI